jgi:plastocyanin
MRKFLAIFAVTLVMTIGLGYAGRTQGQTATGASPTPGEEYCATPVSQMSGTPALTVAAPTTAASPGGAAPGTAIGLVPCGTPIPMKGTPAAGGQQGQGQAQTAPAIELVDIAYNPTQFTIPANTDVTVTLKNTGQLPHTFDIDELNIHSDQVQPGQSATVKINAAAGSYQFYCREPGHKEAGMVGTLTVQ